MISNYTNTRGTTSEMDSYEKPPSPVLNNSNFNRKLLLSKKAERKSRVKLTERFESSLTQNTTCEETQSCDFSEDSFTPSQTENLLQHIESLEENKDATQASTTDFNFRKPMSPVNNYQKSKDVVPYCGNTGGFQTSTGRQIPISAEKTKQHSQLFNDILNSSLNSTTREKKYSYLSKRPKAETIKSCDKIVASGFQSASKKPITIASQLNSKTDLFKNEDLSDLNNQFEGIIPTSETRVSSSEATSAQTPSIGFKSAAGNEVKIPEAAPSEVRSKFAEDVSRKSQFSISITSQSNINSHIFKDEDFSDLAMFKDQIKSNGSKQFDQMSLIGFKKASGSEIQISETILRKVRSKFGEDLNMDSLSLKIANTSEGDTLSSTLDSLKGFSSVEIANAISRSSKFSIFVDEFTFNNGKKTRDLNEKDCRGKRNLWDIETLVDTKRFKSSLPTDGGFATVSGAPINISQNALNKAQKLMKEMSVESSSSCNNTYPSFINSDLYKEINTDSCESYVNTASDFSETSTNANQTVKIENANETSSCNSILTAGEETLIEKRPRTKKRLGVSYKPTLCMPKNKVEKAWNFSLEDVKKSPIRAGNICNSTPIKKAETCTTPLKTDELNSLLNLTITPIRKPEVVSHGENLSDSRLVYQKQTPGDVDTWLNNMESERRKLEMKLSLMTQRQEALNMQKFLLKNPDPNRSKKRLGVLYQKKQNSEQIPLRNFVKPNGNSQFPHIGPQNAELVHFNCSDFPTSVITTLDGAKVIPNTRNLVGLSEVEVAFKIMPGVDSNLIPKNWIRNHYKWIVWKLASYERFDSKLKNCLTVENLIQQLKYRYDREIDRVERPTLRKIFELDDVPQKRMVLCVSDIFKLADGKFELELSDGWYSIRSIIDEFLCEQVRKEKIEIGTKLVICGAELWQCEGCHPLDAIDTIRLKINANSTRRAVWHSKLGYQPVPEPFPIKLHSIHPEGGLLACVRVCVARVYPVKYLEKQGKLSVWRNNKAEEMRAQDWENERLKKIEEVREIVRKDYEKSLNQNENISMNFDRINIKSVTCPRTLYHLYKSSKDPESLQQLLSESQKKAIMDYQQRESVSKQNDLMKKVRDGVDELQLGKRDVTAVLQLVVTDALVESDKGFIFQIWRPTETHLEMLKEGAVFRIYNVLPKKNGDLSSVNRTKFKSETVEEGLEFNKFPRTLLPIRLISKSSGNLFFNQFDTVGVAIEVHVGSFNQYLWLADITGSLLFVEIFEGPKTCLLLENVKKGQIVAASNLTLYNPKKNCVGAVANHCSIISSYPKSKHLQSAVSELNGQLPKDRNGFVEICLEKIQMLQRRSETGNSLDENSEESTLIDSTISTDIAMSLIDVEKCLP